MEASEAKKGIAYTDENGEPFVVLEVLTSGDLVVDLNTKESEIPYTTAIIANEEIFPYDEEDNL